MKAENQADKKVTVYAQHIPDDDFETDTYYPLVIVSLQKVKDAEEIETKPDASTATVSITFGVHGFEPDAWVDLLNIMEHVRQRLLTHRTIANLYRLVLPLEWETAEVQPYPFWFGYGTAVYSIAQPQEGFPAQFERIEEEYE
ncbi:MAG: hypothetical protein IJS96_07015 [Schwartzia sp.]|nr:hypothetical protein [Schwartzia sp. (in: firmicutes)]